MVILIFDYAVVYALARHFQYRSRIGKFTFKYMALRTAVLQQPGRVSSSRACWLHIISVTLRKVEICVSFDQKQIQNLVCNAQLRRWTSPLRERGTEVLKTIMMQEVF